MPILLPAHSSCHLSQPLFPPYPSKSSQRLVWKPKSSKYGRNLRGRPKLCASDILASILCGHTKWHREFSKEIRKFKDFVISYDRRNRTAHWVMEHLSPERMVYNSEVDRSKSMFIEDETIHPYFRSRNEDYKVNKEVSKEELILKPCENTLLTFN